MMGRDDNGLDFGFSAISVYYLYFPSLFLSDSDFFFNLYSHILGFPYPPKFLVSISEMNYIKSVFIFSVFISYQKYFILIYEINYFKNLCDFLPLGFFLI